MAYLTKFPFAALAENVTYLCTSRYSIGTDVDLYYLLAYQVTCYFLDVFFLPDHVLTIPGKRTMLDLRCACCFPTGVGQEDLILP